MVKCKDCGYLAVRLNANRGVVEAEYDFRERHYVPYTHTGPAYDSEPYCFKAAWNLRHEMAKQPSDVQLDEKYVSIMATERECSSFVEWEPGFTPKEHAEIAVKKKMMERQAVIDKEKLDREIAKDKANNLREETRDKANARRFRITAIMQFCGVMTAIVTSILGLYFGNKNREEEKKLPEPNRISIPQEPVQQPKALDVPKDLPVDED